MITFTTILIVITLACWRTLRAIRAMPRILLPLLNPASQSVLVYILLVTTPVTFVCEFIASNMTAYSFVPLLAAGWWAGWMMLGPWTARLLVKMDQIANSEQRAYLRTHEEELRDSI